MKYSFEKAWFHFAHNKVKYGLLIIVYAASMTIFMSCLNLSLSCAEQLRMIKNQTEAEGIELSFIGAYGQEYAITPQDLEDYPDVKKDLFYFPYRDSYVIDCDENEYRYHCCFISDDAFEKIFGRKRETGQTYIGEGAYETLMRLKERAAQQYEDDRYLLHYKFQDDIVYLEDTPVVELTKVKLLDGEQGNIRLNTSDAMFSLDMEQIRMTDCLILPLEMMETLDDAADAMISKSVVAVYPGDRDSENVSRLMTFMHFLADRHPGIQYGISNRVLSLEKSASDLMIPYRSLLIAAVSMLLIIMTGMIGIFILILHRRRKEQAVSLAYGAAKSQIFWEVFAEVFLCFAVGGILACAVAWYVTPKMRIEGISLVAAWHLQTVLYALLITFAEAFGISGIALAVVGRENVAGTLKEL